MFRISLCDDDQIVIESLNNIISAMEINVEILKFNCGEDLIASEYLCNDIVILDIEMKGLNGISTAKNLRDNGYAGLVIFVTSHSELVFDSFNVRPFHYIVKPFTADEIRDVLSKAIKEVMDRKKAHFEVAANEITYRIPLCDIYCFESQGRKVNIYFKDEILTVNYKISCIELCLKSKNFFRCHKGYLVNLAHVFSFSNSEITLTNGQKVLISRGNSQLFKESFKAFMKGNRR